MRLETQGQSMRKIVEKQERIKKISCYHIPDVAYDVEGSEKSFEHSPKLPPVSRSSLRINLPFLHACSRCARAARDTHARRLRFLGRAGLLLSAGRADSRRECVKSASERPTGGCLGSLLIYDRRKEPQLEFTVLFEKLKKSAPRRKVHHFYICKQLSACNSLNGKTHWRTF